MEVTIKELNRVTMITVTGRVDSGTADQLGEKLNAEIDDSSTKNLVVDLSGVEYMSSAGLRELVSAKKRTHKLGGDVKLSEPSDRVREVLDLAGLTTLFEIFDDPVDAVGSY